MQAHLDGFSQRLKREQNERAWTAWHIAALTRCKTMPKLESLLIRDPKPDADWRDMLAKVVAYDKRLKTMN